MRAAAQGAYTLQADLNSTVEAYAEHTEELLIAHFLAAELGDVAGHHVVRALAGCGEGAGKADGAPASSAPRKRRTKS